MVLRIIIDVVNFVINFARNEEIIVGGVLQYVFDLVGGVSFNVLSSLTSITDISTNGTDYDNLRDCINRSRNSDATFLAGRFSRLVVRLVVELGELAQEIFRVLEISVGSIGATAIVCGVVGILVFLRLRITYRYFRYIDGETVLTSIALCVFVLCALVLFLYLVGGIIFAINIGAVPFLLLELNVDFYANLNESLSEALSSRNTTAAVLLLVGAATGGSFGLLSIVVDLLFALFVVIVAGLCTVVAETVAAGSYRPLARSYSIRIARCVILGLSFVLRTLGIFIVVGLLIGGFLGLITFVVLYVGTFTGCGVAVVICGILIIGTYVPVVVLIGYALGIGVDAEVQAERENRRRLYDVYREQVYREERRRRGF